MIRSMTAFASRRGSRGALDWDWDLRGVNGRGLDLRLRVPDGIEGLEPAARAALNARLGRGNVSLTLRLARGPGAGFALDESELDRVLHAFEQVQQRAFALGVTLNQPSAADVLAQRGVVATGAVEEPDEGLLPALLGDLDALVADFVAMREAEGAALGAVIGGQLDRVAALADEAARAADARREEQRGSLRAALDRLRAEVPEVAEERLAQELAVLAVRSDVTEELDRLRAHVAAAREALAGDAPAGRRLDFLAQELNREAGTLLAKSGSAALSRVGLDLRLVIDQMREQVQNVE